MLTVKQIQEAGAKPQSYFFDKKTMKFWGDRLSNYKVLKPEVLQKVIQKYGYDVRVVALVTRHRVSGKVPEDSLGKLYAFNPKGQLVHPEGWPDHVSKIQDLL